MAGVFCSSKKLACLTFRPSRCVYLRVCVCHRLQGEKKTS